jgi:hypothetical protein
LDPSYKDSLAAVLPPPALLHPVERTVEVPLSSPPTMQGNSLISKINRRYDAVYEVHNKLKWHKLTKSLVVFINIVRWHTSSAKLWGAIVLIRVMT